MIAKNDPPAGKAEDNQRLKPTEAASAAIGFTDGNTPMKVGLTVMTDYYAGPDGSAAWVARIVGAQAPGAEFKTVSRLAIMSMASIRIEPAWLAAEIQGSATCRAMALGACEKDTPTGVLHIRGGIKREHEYRGELDRSPIVVTTRTNIWRLKDNIRAKAHNLRLFPLSGSCHIPRYPKSICASSPGGGSSRPMVTLGLPKTSGR